MAQVFSLWSKGVPVDKMLQDALSGEQDQQEDQGTARSGSSSKGNKIGVKGKKRKRRKKKLPKTRSSYFLLMGGVRDQDAGKMLEYVQRADEFGYTPRMHAEFLKAVHNKEFSTTRWEGGGRKKKRRKKKVPKSSSSHSSRREVGMWCCGMHNRAEDEFGKKEAATTETVVFDTLHAESQNSVHSKGVAGYMDEMNKLIEDKVIIGNTGEEIILKNGQPAFNLYSDRTH